VQWWKSRRVSGFLSYVLGGNGGNGGKVAELVVFSRMYLVAMVGNSQS
jgi:hypothetical protein